MFDWVMATLYELGLVCFNQGKDAWGGRDGMGIKVAEGPAVGVGGGHDCRMGIPACVSLSGSNLSLWDCFPCLHLWFFRIQLSWACILGVQTCCTRVPQTHIPCILVPLVHNCVLLYSSPAIIEFWVLLVVVEVRGWVVIIVIVERLMGTATIIIAISPLGTATTHWFVDFHGGWGLRFELQVQVRPLLEPEPAKRFGFRYSAEPDSQTPGSKSGLNQVQKVWEPDHGQSIEVEQFRSKIRLSWIIQLSGSVETESCEMYSN